MYLFVFIKLVLCQCFVGVVTAVTEQCAAKSHCLDMDDFLSNRWFFHICAKCENETKGRIRFCKDLKLFLGPCFSVEAVLSSCLCTAVHSCPAQQERWHCWGDTEAALNSWVLLLFSELLLWVLSVISISSGTETWGFHFCSDMISSSCTPGPVHLLLLH